jgi:hypothetical protein
LTACLACGAAFAQPALGRRRRYCSRACRALAYRERHAVTKLQDDPQVPPMPASASQSFPHAFATFVELDAYLEERS